MIQVQYGTYRFPVIEIFDSIQGEGCNLGKYCTFIRLAGCNLRCPWCDSINTWTDDDATYLTVGEIISSAKQHHVVITGGEPGVHTGEGHFNPLKMLCQALKEAGHYISVETNGHFELPSEVDWVTCSPKPLQYFISPKVHPNEFKYVVDQTFSLEFIPKNVLDEYPGKIWLQPEANCFEESCKKCMELVQQDSRLRVGIQLHKVIGVN